MNKKGFKHNTFGDLVYLTVPAISRTGVCSHAFTTRLGGVSRGHLASMNLGLHRGDEIENVRENLRILGRHGNFCVEKSIYTAQTHSSIVLGVDESYAGSGAFLPSKIYEADGIITNKPGIPLVAYLADCVSIILLDPIKKVAAVCHSGWRGTLLKIAGKTVDKMSSDYKSQAEDILAAIGPSIGPCHFEVMKDVAERFQKVFPHDNGFITKIKSGQDGQDMETKLSQATYTKENEKYMIDLQSAVSKTLHDCGITKKNIYESGECTFCRPDKYFSHRYFKGKNGNIAAVIELK